MNELDRWTVAAAEALGLDPSSVSGDTTTVLDLARNAAHEVLRPAAPLTTYLLGVAVGRGADPADAAATLTRLAQGWAQAKSPPAQG